MLEDQNTQSTNYELISVDQPQVIFDRLVSLGVCQSNESIVSIEKAGEGNMNLVLRVTLGQRSVVVKQARPWVEKYPAIAAPDERILSEIDFYQSITDNPDVRSALPTVLAADTQQRLLILEDLGTASDYSILYQAGDQAETNTVFEQAIGWILKLHQHDVSQQQQLGCLPLRQLNHQHIFAIPLTDPPAIDLDAVCPGLTNASRSVGQDTAVQQTLEKLGQTYLSQGGQLLHGDFYPGSWLNTDAGFRVIDPEFCFCGPAEFDLGVLAAHWIFSGADPDASVIDRVCTTCDRAPETVSRQLVTGFAGAELVRRLIGVAQLPLDADLDQRQRWLQCGVQFLKQSV